MKTLKFKSISGFHFLLSGIFFLTFLSCLSDAVLAETYGERLRYDLKRGTKNILTAPLEIAVGFQEYHERAGWPFVRQGIGILVGAGKGVLRLGSGVVDLLVAGIPGLQKGLPVNPEILF